MKYACLLLLLFLIGPTILAIGMFGNSLFAQNNTALEQAQKSLDENQKKSSSFLPDTLGNNATKDSSQVASKITKGGAMSTYENSDYGVSIKFPSSWKSYEVNLAPIVIARFEAPETSENPTSVLSYVYVPAWVIVASQILPADNMTLNDYVKFVLKDVYQNTTQYRIISSSKGNLAGFESIKMTLYEYDAESLKVLRNVAIDPKTNIGYIVKYMAHPGMFPKYLPIAEQMMNSFEVK